MGDTSDISFSDTETMRPHAGRTCIKFGYQAQGGGGWAGIFWQNPANNWGSRPGAGYDLSRYKKLTFWARGEKGGEVLTEVKVGGIKGEHPDSSETSISCHSRTAPGRARLQALRTASLAANLAAKEAAGQLRPVQ